MRRGWRDGRVDEGVRLLSECRVKSSTEGSNPSLSASHHCHAMYMADRDNMSDKYPLKTFSGYVSPLPAYQDQGADTVRLEMHIA